MLFLLIWSLIFEQIRFSRSSLQPGGLKILNRRIKADLLNVQLYVFGNVITSGTRSLSVGC